MKKEVEKKVKKEKKVVKKNYYAINAMMAFSLVFVGLLIGILAKYLDNISYPSEKVESSYVHDIDKKPVRGNEEFKYNSSITKLTKEETKRIKDSKHDFIINVEDYEMSAYIVNKKVYFEGYEVGREEPFMFKVNVIDNAVKIRTFNASGHSDDSPAYYVICEDGKVYEIQAFEMNENFSIYRVFSDYEVADITHLDTFGCDIADAGRCGHMDLVLKDGSERVIWY